ncbi:MAG: hypothetical protein AAGI53_16410 [Planctomycetota bacterium]
MNDQTDAVVVPETRYPPVALWPASALESVGRGAMNLKIAILLPIILVPLMILVLWIGMTHGPGINPNAAAPPAWLELAVLGVMLPVMLVVAWLE